MTGFSKDPNEAAQDLMLCLCTALGGAGWTGDCCLETGEHVWDTCCEADGGHGQAWARVTRVYPSDRFPTPSESADPSKDDSQWVVEVELGAITCVCREGCDCDVKAENANLVVGYATAALAAIACCYGGDTCDSDFRVGELKIEDEEGMCAGFTMRAYVPTTFCCT